MFLPEFDFKEYGFDSDILTTMSGTKDPLYNFDLKSMQKSQLNDVSLMTMVRRHIIRS